MAVVTPSGRLPRADWRKTANYWVGHDGRKAAVIHINQGHFEASIEHMARHGTSAHFEVGKKGKIAQMVNVNDSAWCNGLSYNAQAQRWVCPHGHVVRPTWELLRPGDDNPNRTTISIENEGFSGQPWSASQFDANVEILVWLGGLFPSLLPYRVGSTLLGHFHIDPRDKAGCPGKGADLPRMAETANRLLGLDQLWRKRWAARGIDLPEEIIGWAIPQLYKQHSEKLGACLAAETYPHPSFSIAVFEHGFIYFLKTQQKAFTQFIDLGV